MKSKLQGWRVGALVAACFLGFGTAAGAYELSLLYEGPSQVETGDLVSFDVYLDTQGASGIMVFSAGLVFDPALFKYEPTLSDAEDYYPLYAPVQGKVGPTWLDPIADPPIVWPVAPFNQVNVAFIETSLGSTFATTSNLKLATLTFRALGSSGVGEFNWGVEGFADGAFLAVGSCPDVSTPGTTSIAVVGDQMPVPGLAPIGVMIAAVLLGGVTYARTRAVGSTRD